MSSRAVSASAGSGSGCISHFAPAKKPPNPCSAVKSGVRFGMTDHPCV
jgi:hypothetical protein